MTTPSDKQTDNQPALQPPDEPCPFCGIIPSQNASPWKHIPHKRGCFISIIAQQDMYIRADQLPAWNTRARVVDGVVDRLRAALKDIASQRLRSEIEPVDGEISGDFEGAYDIMINVAREALAATTPIAAPVEEVEDRIPCQRCGLFGGKVVSFNYDSIKTARWICPRCLDGAERSVK